MKLSITKTVKFITIVPILALIGIVGYAGYEQYNTYQETIPLVEKVKNNNEIVKLLDLINQEKELSSTYYGSAGVKNEKKLRDIYTKIDAKIYQVNRIIKREYNKEELIEDLKKIEKIRKKTLNLDIEFSQMFKYYTDLENELYNLIKSQKIVSKNAEIVINNINYLNIIKTINQVSTEKAFVAKAIEEYIPLTPEDIKNMEVLFSSSKYIEPQGLLKKDIQDKIKKLSENIYKIEKELSEMKNNISYSAETGEFVTKRVDWELKEDEKKDYIKTIRKILNQDTIKEIQNTVELQQITFLIIAGVLLLALLFLIMSNKVSNALQNNIKDLTKTFKSLSKISGHEEDIDLDTTEGQKNAYAVIEDSIQVLKESKDKAIKANESKSMFLANMSHEIRTPLNGIVGFTELLTHTKLDEEQLEFVETIEKSSENLLSIINDILDLSKIESEKIEIEEIVFDPLFHFEQAAELYGAKAAEKNIDLSFYIDPLLNEYNIKGDPTRLKEVIINLMSNAVKFTPKNGNIKVNIITKGRDKNDKLKVYFEVKDSGIGIEKDKIGLIFQAFSQADSSTTRKFGGTGLGLTISSKFVELMGGKLQVKSEYGNGTTFYFEIPFETSESKNPKIKNIFEGTNVTFIHSKKTKAQNENIINYMKYMGIKITEALNSNQMKEADNKSKVHAYLLDYDFILEQAQEEKQKFLDINEKPCLLIIKPTLSKNEKEFSQKENVKYLFEPISLTKINKLITTFKDKLIHKEIEEKVEERKKDNKKEEIVEEGLIKNKEFTGKVLAAEDNIINQKLIRKTLEKFNLQIDIVDNGEKAVEARKEYEYDIIFMDNNMPIMTGVEATHEILKWEELNNVEHIPIIAITANALKGDRERFLNEGMDEYITKPLNKSDIESVLKKFFGSKQIEEFIEKNKG